MKYKLEEQADGHFRIRALKSFSCKEIRIKKGQLGGIVSGKEVLSQVGSSWIDYDSAVLYSTVTCDSYIQNSEIHRSTVIDCHIQNSYLEGTHSRWCKLQDVTAYGITLRGCNFNTAVIKGLGELVDCEGINFNINVNTTIIAQVLHHLDYIEFKNYSTSKRYFGYFYSTDTWKIGCFEGTTAELLKHLRKKATAKQRSEYLQHVIQCRKLIHIEKHKQLSLWQSLWIELRTQLYK